MTVSGFVGQYIQAGYPARGTGTEKVGFKAAPAWLGCKHAEESSQAGVRAPQLRLPGGRAPGLAL